MYTNRSFTLAAILALVAVAAITARMVLVPSVSALDPQALDAQQLERSRAADTARWNAMAEHYQTLGVAQSLGRSLAAETARWTAMAEYYQRLEASQLERGRAADTARWNAMALYYRLKGQN